MDGVMKVLALLLSPEAFPKLMAAGLMILAVVLALAVLMVALRPVLELFFGK